MKFCKDCKFCEVNGEEYSRCVHPSLKLPEMVFTPVMGEELGQWIAADGTPQSFKPFCKSVREGSRFYLCGHDANLFEELSHG